jgi:hypothetical protein
MLYATIVMKVLSYVHNEGVHINCERNKAVNFD